MTMTVLMPISVASAAFSADDQGTSSRGGNAIAEQLSQLHFCVDAEQSENERFVDGSST